MKRLLCTIGSLAILLCARPASAGLFEDIMGGGSKKKAAAQAKEAFTRKFKFVVHLTTGDMLKGIEYKGGGTRKKGSFRFISNFESDIDVKTAFIKYVDMDMIGDQVLEEEYLSSKSDRVYLKNQDYLTGKILGFSAKDVLVTTSYGDIKADIAQVRYVMFRNPGAAAETKPLMQESKPAAPAAQPAAEPAKTEE